MIGAILYTHQREQQLRIRPIFACNSMQTSELVLGVGLLAIYPLFFGGCLLGGPLVGMGLFVTDVVMLFLYFMALSGARAAAGRFDLMAKAAELRRLAGDSAPGTVISALREAHAGQLRWVGQRNPEAWFCAPRLVAALRESGGSDDAERREVEAAMLAAAALPQHAVLAYGSGRGDKYWAGRAFFPDEFGRGSGRWLLRIAELHAAKGDDDATVLAVVQRAAAAGGLGNYSDNAAMLTDSTLLTGTLSRAPDARVKAIAKAKHDWDEQREAEWEAARVRNDKDALWVFWSAGAKSSIVALACYMVEVFLLSGSHGLDSGGEDDGSGDGGGMKDTIGNRVIWAVVSCGLCYIMWWGWAKVDAAATRALRRVFGLRGGRGPRR
jgi:hypothetical protein